MAVAKKKAAPKKKTTARKTTRKATAKKPARKPAAKKTTTTKKAAPKKKTTAKKTTAKKTTAKKATTRKAAPKKTAAKKTTTKRKPSAAFMKPMTPSSELAEIVGKKPLPRTEVTKKVWSYIKKKDLQDPENRRMIVADDKLKGIFGRKKKVSMFEMTKLISQHLS